MPRIYKYLVNGADREPRDVLELNEQFEVADPKFVVHDESDRSYLVFNSYVEFKQWFELSDRRSLHEVIRGQAPQKLKFDIDAEAAVIAQIVESPAPVKPVMPEISDLDIEFGLDGLIRDDYAADLAAYEVALAKYNAMTTEQRRREMLFQTITAAICETMLDYHAEKITTADFAISDSSDDSKFSRHIVLPQFVVANNVEAAFFTTGVISKLPKHVAKALDAGVNKSLQNFRLPNCHKCESTRIKRVIQGTDDDMVITQVGDVMPLFALAPAEKGIKFEQNIGGEEVQRALELLAPHIDGFEFSEQKGSMLLFRRKTASMCPICKVVHTNDNTAFATVVNSTIKLHCRHSEQHLGRKTSMVVGELPELPFNFEKVMAAAEIGEANEVNMETNKVMFNGKPHAMGKKALIAIIDKLGPVRRRRDNWDLTMALVVNASALMDDRESIYRHAWFVWTARDNAAFDAQKTKDRFDTVRGCAGQARAWGLLARWAEIDTPYKTAEQRIEHAIAFPKNMRFKASEGIRVYKYDQATMRDFRRSKTLVITAPTKMGKTKALVKYIDKHFNGANILFLSFRETFTTEIAKKFPGTTIYRDIKGPIDMTDHRRIIVQVESLHRFDTSCRAFFDGAKLDLVVMDESESILAQLNSPMHRHFNETWAKFEWVMKYAEHVIAMDAFTTNRTLNTLKHYRGTDDYRWVINEYQNATAYTYDFTADRELWHQRLFEDLRAGKRVFIPTNSSATKVKALTELIRQKMPEKVIIAYTSETDAEIKKADIQQIEESWTTADVLIFTPTITAGVSFESEHFDRVYAAWSASSCPVRDCEQMVARVRAVKDKRVVVLLDAKTSRDITSVKAMKKLVKMKRTNLFKVFNDDRITYTIMRDGSLDIKDKGYFNLWALNRCIENQSRINFIREYISLIKSTGAACQLIRKPEAEPEEKLVKEIKTIAAAIKLDENREIVDAAEITQEDAKKMMESGDALPHADRVKLTKYKLRNHYGMMDEMKLEWVITHHQPRVMQVFSNLRVARTQTLEQIQDTERNYLLEAEEKAGIRTETRFDRHRIAQGLLRIFGFEDTLSTAQYTSADMRKIVEDDTKVEILKQFLADARLIFQISQKDVGRNSVKKALGWVNSVLEPFYGIRITLINREANARLRRYGLVFVGVPEYFSTIYKQ